MPDENCTKLFIENLAQKSSKEIMEYADRIAAQCEKKAARSISVNHILEWYLYQYYSKIEQLEEITEPIHFLYKTAAEKYKNEKNFERQYMALKKAFHWNPADMETLFALVKYAQENQNMEEMREYLDALFPYVFTKTDLARYYRYMGCYYLEKYKPELAMALYQYSELLSASKMAEKEMQYLKKAVPSLPAHMEIEQIQSAFQKEKLPLQPARETLGLMYHVGKQQLLAGNREYAHILLQNLYELTGDEEVKRLCAV